MTQEVMLVLTFMAGMCCGIVGLALFADWQVRKAAAKRNAVLRATLAEAADQLRKSIQEHMNSVAKKKSKKKDRKRK